jgi:hypothetical protein
MSGVYTHGAQPIGKTLGPAQLETRPQVSPTAMNFLDLTHRHNIPTQPRVAGSASRTHLEGSITGGELMHKLIKAVTHERLRHYERITWSRRSITCDDQPDMWPSL